MELINHICPDSPYVWNHHGVSNCFNNLVLGFGVNLLTIFIVAFLGISRGRGKESRRRPIHLTRKIILDIVAVLGACLALFDIVVLIGTRLNNGHTPYHEWLFNISQFSLWLAILLVLRCETWPNVLCSGMLCMWWIMKVLVFIPRLQIVSSLPEVIRWIKEIFVIISEIVFGILIIIIRTKSASFGESSMEESLLPRQRERKEGYVSKLGVMFKFWHIMTFKSIDPVMQYGVNKQLDFDHLLQLPLDMDPYSCHITLLRIWNSQQQNNIANPSLFKTIYSAYGWPYFCIGLLKVVNDCLGFAGPLLLNKLIRFLQQGLVTSNNLLNFKLHIQVDKFRLLFGSNMEFSGELCSLLGYKILES